MSIIWLRDLTFSRQVSMFLKGHIEVMFLLSRRRQNKAHAGRIQPAAEADSNQIEGSVLSIQFRCLLN